MKKYFCNISMLAVMGLAGGVITCLFLNQVTEWGHYIPSANIANDYAAALLLSVAIATFIAALPIAPADKKILLILWLCRSLTTLGFMLFYENNYGLDAYTYFLEAKEISYDESLTGFGKGTGNIGWLIWFLNQHLPIRNSYHSLKVIFSFIGLTSIFIIYSAAVRYSGLRHPKLLLYLGMFPSIIFWSSILGKDPIMLFGISLYAAGILYWMATKNPLWILAAFSGGLIASGIRPWTAFILTLPLLTLGLFHVKGILYRVAYIALASGLTIASVQLFVEHFTFKGVDDLVKKTNLISRSWSIGGSRQEVPEFTSVGQMIAFAPMGMFTALFRPLPGEVPNLFGTMAGVENAFLLYLVYLAFRNFSWAKFRDPAVVWGISLLLSWSFIYSYVSYQNLGSAFRFRLQILPLLLLLLIALGQEKKEEIRP